MSSDNLPAYIGLFEKGEFKKRCDRLMEMLSRCRLCPRNCGVDRMRNEKGFCNSGKLVIVSDYLAHFGEEPVLVGRDGSGTIFFGNCNLRCVYCQNYQISQNPKAQLKNEITFEKLAQIMLELQGMGCHNINFVSPTHFVPQIVSALLLAIPKGLRVPLVYNTNGYDSLEVIKLLDGIIDIYLPDAKYSNDKLAKEYSAVGDYVLNNRLALKEMYRQVSDLVVDEDGVAKRGLIIRHLVLPNDLAGSLDTLQFIKDELSNKATLAIMSQYYPTNKAHLYPLVNRKITKEEYEKVLHILYEFGFENSWTQELTSPHVYLPDFDREIPFDRKQIRDEI